MNITIDRESVLPLQHQFKEAIKDAIAERTLQEGQKIPSERELAEKYNLSRITVSASLGKLVNEGILVRKRGRGTHVSSDSALLRKNLSVGKKGRTTKTVGLILLGADTIATPYFSKLLRPMHKYCEQSRLCLQFFSPQQSTHQHQALFEAIKRKELDGILVLDEIQEQYLTELKESNIPMVLVNLQTENDAFHSVRADLVQGLTAIIEYLTSLGHTRIAYITGSLPNVELYHSDGKTDVFRQILQKHNLPFEQELVKQSNYSEEEGHDLTLELLGLSTPPTAIVCADDFLALGALNAVNAAGKKVPDYVSIIGMGDYLHRDFLSTVRVPFEEIGLKAMETLTKLMNNEEITKDILLRADLLIRKSTAGLRIIERKSSVTNHYSSLDSEVNARNPVVFS